MPKLSDIRRIVPEDFEPEFQDTASKIAGSYNEFSDELYQIVNGQLDFDNLARRKVSLDIVVNSSGVPTVTSRIVTGLTQVSMIYIGNIQNMTNGAALITTMPYINWVNEGNGQVKINYVTNLIAGNKYRLTLEIVQ